MKYGVVYLLTNLVNGKYYIGQTRNIGERLRHHLAARKDHDYPINRAIRKYGRNSFASDILGEAEVGEELNNLERLWIAISNATDRHVGYNLREGGSVSGFNEETRKRMSIACKNRKPQSPESIKKRADSMRGRKCPEHSARMMGRIKSPETCRKLSESLKGHPISQETREKISVTLKAKKLTMSPEHRIIVSMTQKKLWAARRAEKGVHDANSAS